MRGWRHLIWIGIGIVILAGCGSEAAPRPGGPVLVREVTVAPSVPPVTRVLSPSPSPVVIPLATSPAEAVIELPTVDARFVLQTATLPPSKTPTLTPTRTTTFTATIPPTITPTVTPLPVTALPGTPQFESGSPRVTAAPGPAFCEYGWFFYQPTPAMCPLSSAAASNAAFQQFQQGFMIWVEQQDAIYVLYQTPERPRWQVFQDQFTDGMPDSDPAYVPPMDGLWPPRRGFGLLWRGQPAVRERMGWALSEGEQPFTTRLQIGTDGTIFMERVQGVVLALRPSADWQQYGN